MDKNTVSSDTHLARIHKRKSLGDVCAYCFAVGVGDLTSAAGDLIEILEGTIQILTPRSGLRVREFTGGDRGQGTLVIIEPFPLSFRQIQALGEVANARANIFRPKIYRGVFLAFACTDQNLTEQIAFLQFQGHEDETPRTH